MKTLRARSRISGDQGFTLMEIMIALFLLGLLGSVAGLFYVKIKADGRASVCVGYQDRLWEAKRGVWAKYEDLTTRTDPDADILAYMDPHQLPACPDRGSHKPTGSNPVTSVHVLASYNLHATDEATRPTCRINPAAHVKDMP